MDNQLDEKFDKFICSEMNEFTLEESFEEQWSKMAVALENRSFWQFTLKKFNIYYLSLILASLFLALVFYKNILSKENVLLEGDKGTVIQMGENYIVEDSNSIESTGTLIKSNDKSINKATRLVYPDSITTKTFVTEIKNNNKATIDSMTNVAPVNTVNSIKSQTDSILKPLPKKIK